MDATARRVLDALPVSIYTVDLDGTVTGAMGARARCAAPDAPTASSGGEPGGHLDGSPLDGPGAREQIRHAASLLRSGRVETMSWEVACGAPPEERLYLLQMVPLRDGHAVTSFVLSAADITPSHRVRAALLDIGAALARPIDPERVFLELSQQLRRAVPYDGLVVALPDGAGEMRVAYATGYAGAAGELAERLAGQWREALAHGRPVSGPAAPGPASAQAPGALELTVPLRAAGVAGALTVQTEAADSPQRRREAEWVLAGVAAHAAAAIERARLVRQAEERRQRAAVGDVLTGLAHVVRNPLFGISSAAQLLRFRAREDPVVERNVGRILREAERLNALVSDLLEYGRPRPLALAAADPDETWDEVLEGNHALLEMRSLALTRTRARHAGHRAHPHWMVDREQLAQAFRNVLTNAVDAAPADSDLTLASTVLPDGAWRCTLRNAGPEVPPDALPRVFDLFFSTKQGGTGVGLTISRRIVEDHGGTLTLDSGPGGTTVTITLPPSRGRALE